MSLADTGQKHVLEGDGATDEFAFEFAIMSAADVKVFKKNSEDEDGEVIPIDSNFTVTPNARNANNEIVGGIVKYPNSGTKLVGGEYLVITRRTIQSQGLLLSTNGEYDADAHEAALDKLTMITQDLKEQINRAIKYPVDQSPTNTDVANLTSTIVNNITNTVIQQVVGDIVRTGTFATLDAIGGTTMFLAVITDQQVIGVYLGNRALGQNGWAFIGGY